MEVIYGAIHGAYAYLLIFQILVVTALFLTLLWLIVKRTRDGALYAGAEAFDSTQMTATLGAPAAAAAYAANAAQAAAGEATSANAAEQPAASAASAVDHEKLRKSEEDNNALAEKVKFLESKLLEYEILQEEIGALGALKTENERLKQRLVALEQGGGAVPAAPSAEAATSEPDGQSPQQLAEQLASAFDTKALFTAEAAPSAPAPAETPATTAESAPAKKAANLDDLLSQIDSLTSGDR